LCWDELLTALKIMPKTPLLFFFFFFSAPALKNKKAGGVNRQTPQSRCISPKALNLATIPNFSRSEW